jgi:ubiquinone/menaquinone biosynthesis C-methylase UbiE
MSSPDPIPIALPLAAAAVPVVGLDLSGQMLGKIVEKAGGRIPFPLVMAGATRLPFGDDRFGGAYARHVLHLIAD